MAKKAPSGLGLWIAFENKITPGQSVEKSIELAKKVGAKWVAPRGGGNLSGGHNLRDPGLPPGAIKQYKDAGLDVYVWVFSYPYDLAAADEVELYGKFVEEGADGVIVNAEINWKFAGADERAKKHVAAIRKRVGPDVWVAHAPFAFPEYHRDFPYKGFAGLDAVLGQLYWTEFSDAGAKAACDKFELQWKNFKKTNPELATQPVHPIGVTYGHELGAKWNMKQAPPGKFKVSDLEHFLDRFESDAMPSLYTLEAMCDDARDYLAARAAAKAPKVPEPVAPKEEPKQSEPTVAAVDAAKQPEEKPVDLPKQEPIVQPQGIQLAVESQGFFAAIMAFFARLFAMFFCKK